MHPAHPFQRKHLLREARVQRNWRQADLAERLGTTELTVQRWERGSQQPGAYYRLKLCALFGKSAEELGLTETETFPQGPAEREAVEAAPSLSPARETAIWTIPFPRNPFFTGREAILQTLHERLSREGSLELTQSWAISGLGGIGKTQTVLEYAYRHVHDYTAIFWICAETTETILASFTAVADVLDLPEKEKFEQERITAVVLHWLKSHEGWLLIFDNVEEPEVVRRYVPASHHGALLFTSRRRALGLSAPTVDLETMTLEEGTRFLIHRARVLAPTVAVEQLAPEELETAYAIVEAMDGLPLALDQAGAYIEATQCGLTTYLQHIRSSQLRLLNERASHAEHPLSVARTFLLAFEQVQRNNTLAVEILMACAFLAPEAIPELFFTQGADQLGATFASLTADPLQFDAALRELLVYSLLWRDATTHTLTIHRLVQAVLRENLPEAGQQKWRGRVMCAMARLFPAWKSSVDYFQISERLLPHALICLRSEEQEGVNGADRITLGNAVGSYFTNCTRFIEAKALFEQALHMGESLLGSEHPLVVETLRRQAYYYKVQGKYTEAKLHYQRVLSIREKTVGPDHPLVAETLQGLATLYVKQGKYDEAEPLFQRALPIQKYTHEVASILNSLASIYKEQGKYEKAEQFFQQALLLQEQAVGEPNHPYRAHMLNDLAELYFEQGKYEQAEPLFQQALQIFVQVMGPEHPDVVSSLNGLAKISQAQGKYEQAESFFQQALQILKQTLGSDHPDLAQTFNGLADLYRVQRNYAEAESLYERALRIREHHLHPGHPLIAETLYSQATLFAAQEKYSEAYSSYQRSFSIREQVFGSSHSRTIETSEHLQAVSMMLNQADQAIHLDGM